MPDPVTGNLQAVAAILTAAKDIGAMGCLVWALWLGRLIIRDLAPAPRRSSADKSPGDP